MSKEARCNRRYIAKKLRKLRGKRSQMEFGKLIGKHQSVITRLENPNYEGITLKTLTEIAEAVNMAVYVEIVTPAEFAELSRKRLDGIKDKD